jgi:hypothetical protein
MHPAVERSLGHVRYGTLVFFGLPVAALLAALLFAPPLASAVAGRGAALRFIPWAGAVIATDQSFIGLGHLCRMVSFTYGDQTLMEHPFRALLWGLPVCLFLGGLGTERALRAALPTPTTGESGGAFGGRVGAMAFSIVAGTITALPPILRGSPFVGTPFLAGGIATALLRETALVFLYLGGGGLAVSGLLRGAFMYLERFVITDTESLWLPMAQVTTSDPRFYLLRVATAAAALLLAAWSLRRRRAASASLRATPGSPRSATDASRATP